MASVIPKNILVESRYFTASIVIMCFTGILLFRLWYVQIYQGEHYRMISESNRIRRIEIPAGRGLLYDRHGQLVLGNRLYYDLVYIPQYAVDQQATLEVLARLLHVPVGSFYKRLKASKGSPKFLPIILKRNLSLHEVSIIDSNRLFLPGVDVATAPRRDYRSDTPPHLVGHIAEIDPLTMKRLNAENSDNPYAPGDLIGKQGLESRWESVLRGKRGYRLIQVDAFGRQTKTFPASVQLPEVAAVPGTNLILTIDQDLQRAAAEAFKGKNGAIVVIRPSDGQVLALISEPGITPQQYQDGLSREEWRVQERNPFSPFLDKTTGGEFPPGSVYKAIVAMAALEEGIISPESTRFCPGHFTVGDEEFRCHQRQGHGSLDLYGALTQSCDVYFYHLGVDLGADRIARYAKAFGLGSKLGFNLNMEKPGLVPTTAWKKRFLRMPWSPGETPVIAIGQGYNLVTPMQIASLYATIANGGKIWRPYLVNKAVSHVGETLLEQKPELLGTVDIVKAETFAIIHRALQEVVMHPQGTGKAAKVPGVTVAGKTGTVQVVALGKNKRLASDVSMKWREHAIFAAFSPTENAEIAVAIVSENDKVGGGGASAAPVAGKIIQAYWDKKAILAQQASRSRNAPAALGSRNVPGSAANSGLPPATTVGNAPPPPALGEAQAPNSGTPSTRSSPIPVPNPAADSLPTAQQPRDSDASARSLPSPEEVKSETSM